MMKVGDIDLETILGPSVCLYNCYILYCGWYFHLRFNRETDSLYVFFIHVIGMGYMDKKKWKVLFLLGIKK